MREAKSVGPLSPRRGVPVRGSLTREGRFSVISARIFVGPLAERSSPREPSLANSPAIREARFARRVGPVRVAPLTGPTRPARGGGDAPSRQGRGTPPSRVRLCERTYPPEGGERRSPIYIRGSFARTRRDPSRQGRGTRLPPREGGASPAPGGTGPFDKRSGPVRDATFALKRPSRVRSHPSRVRSACSRTAADTR